MVSDGSCFLCKEVHTQIALKSGWQVSQIRFAMEGTDWAWAPWPELTSVHLD